MMPPTEVPVRVLALLAYTITAVVVAWTQRENAWFVLHATAAIAGMCALSLAVSYAGALGAAAPGDGGDQADDYIIREDWDD